MEASGSFCSLCEEFKADCQCVGGGATRSRNPGSLCSVKSVVSETVLDKNGEFVSLPIKIESDIESAEIKQEPFVAIPPISNVLFISNVSERFLDNSPLDILTGEPSFSVKQEPLEGVDSQITYPEFESVYLKEEPIDSLHDAASTQFPPGSIVDTESSVECVSNTIKTNISKNVSLPATNEAAAGSTSILKSQLMSNRTHMTVNFKCYMCSNRVSSNVFLESSIEQLIQKYSNKLIACTKCEQESSKKQQQAETPRDVETAPNQIECRYCGKSFSFYNNLSSHIRLMHPSFKKGNPQRLAPDSKGEKTALKIFMSRESNSSDDEDRGCTPHGNLQTDNSVINQKELMFPTLQKSTPQLLVPNSNSNIALESLTPELHSSDADDSPRTPDHNRQATNVSKSTFIVPLVCSICNAKFLQASDLAWHYGREHPNELMEVLRSSSVGMYTCNICEEVFSTELCLSEHSETHGSRLAKIDQNEKLNLEQSTYAVCGICNLKLSSKSNLKVHFRQAHPVSHHACRICSEIFRTSRQLQAHSEMHGTKEMSQSHSNRQKLDSRKEVNTVLPQLELSEQKHVGSVPISHTCKVCQAQFKTMNHLLNHLREAHSGHGIGTTVIDHSDNLTSNQTSNNSNEVVSRTTDFPPVRARVTRRTKKVMKDIVVLSSSVVQCNICKKRFSSVKNCYKHKLIHDKRHECDICKRRYIYKGEVIKHMVTHMDKDGQFRLYAAEVEKRNAAYRCHTCYKHFSSKKNLKTHLLVHDKRVVCDLCQKRFVYKCDLRKHFVKKHNKNLTSHSYKTDDYKCDFCDEHFGEKVSCVRHMLAHLKPFKCEICFVSFRSESKLLAHKRKHSVTGEFKCGFCLQAFNTRKDLKTHIMRHVDSFTCELCNRLFPYKHSVRKHVMLHFNKNYIQCGLCLKFSAGQSNHADHMRFHENPFAFTCEFCDVSFASKRNLQSHLIKHKQDLRKAKKAFGNDSDDEKSQCEYL